MKDRALREWTEREFERHYNRISASHKELNDRIAYLRAEVKALKKQLKKGKAS